MITTEASPEVTWPPSPVRGSSLSLRREGVTLTVAGPYLTVRGNALRWPWWKLAVILVTIILVAGSTGAIPLFRSAWGSGLHPSGPSTYSISYIVSTVFVVVSISWLATSFLEFRLPYGVTIDLTNDTLKSSRELDQSAEAIADMRVARSRVGLYYVRATHTLMNGKRRSPSDVAKREANLRRLRAMTFLGRAPLHGWLLGDVFEIGPFLRRESAVDIHRAIAEFLGRTDWDTERERESL